MAPIYRVLIIFMTVLAITPVAVAKASSVVAEEALPSADQTLVELYDQADHRGMQQAGVHARVEYFAQVFLAQKSPYIVAPLGEGPTGEFEKGPLYRFDGFDCTTFVETVLALARAESSSEFLSTLNQIRYREGRVAYENRNHFPSIDWIPNNSKAGFVKDITGRIAGTHTKWSQTWIEKDEWLRMKGVDFQKLSSQFKKELGRLPYIAKEDLIQDPQLENQIPSGVIFHVVRPNWDLKKAIGTQLDVSHEGFLIREQGVLYMVHASNGLRDGGEDYKGVKKEALRDYILRVMMKSPSMAGLNILKIQDP